MADLRTAWPAATALRRALLAEGSLDVLEHALVPGGPTPAVLRCETAVHALDADPLRPIAGLAAELGVSHGHLDREFTEIVGLSPRVLSRILRLRALLAAIDVYAPVDWPGLAAAYGWFDQSHFIRDFRRHTGVTPTAYVAAQRAAFTPDLAAPGFTPDLAAPSFTPDLAAPSFTPDPAAPGFTPDLAVDVKSVQDTDHPGPRR